MTPFCETDQVLNIRGEQIGHVPREMASFLTSRDGTRPLKVENSETLIMGKWMGLLLDSSRPFFAPH